jgi:hypothetical protein
VSDFSAKLFYPFSLVLMSFDGNMMICGVRY